MNNVSKLVLVRCLTKGIEKMKNGLLILVLCVLSVPAFAECFGTGNYKNCWDDKGNTYDVSRFGNTTEVSGYNARTGSRWSETATTYGNTTNIEGKDANGNRWNEDITVMGNSVTVSGRDASGRNFYKSCYKNLDGSMDCY